MTIHTFLKRIVTTLLILSGTVSAAPAQEKSASFRWASCPDCPFPDMDTAFLRQENIQFGYLTVPENRSKPDSRKIRIAVQVFRARKPEAGKPPMIILHGGPGGRAVGVFSPEYDSIRQESDIILMDQRGSGFSGPDFTPEMNQEILEILAKDLKPEEETKERLALAAKVRDSLLARGVDLTAYNSREMAADIHDLCQLLGYTSWDLWGTSYGTRVALTMMKEYPEGIRSVILASPLPPNVRYFENVTPNFKRSLDLLCDKCKADPDCNRSYPNLREDFTAAINGLERQPVIIPMDDPHKYPGGRFVINAQDMLLAIQQALYSRDNYPLIPIIIEQVKNRNIPALKRFVENMSNGIFRLQYGAYYSVICQECMPFNRLQAFEDASAKSWQGVTFYKDEFSICKLWNAGPFRAEDTAAVHSDIPVLILSGEMDPIAAVAGAELAHRSLPRSFLYVLEGTGHFVVNETTTRLINRFLANPEQAPDGQHVITQPGIPFVTNVHISDGVVAFAPRLPLQRQNWLYTAWLVLLVVLPGVSLWLAARAYRRYKHAGKSRLTFYLMLLNVLLGLVFLVAIIMAIVSTSRANFRILGFGLPEQYAIALMLPYAMLAICLVLVSLWLAGRKKYQTDKWYLSYLLLQAPFICFVVYFGLFY
ncbi:alpha/beta fold hydrolase [Chitinophaga oryzae]|uniref:Alpha/beta fold hydrolase n=1 Tax=Chitinophaga oryzae TaxID=2725414 RepID=A0ABX6LDD6_9BACT|nr:alpha/beta fold hydrolase [Chitinophaga oryzae]QJB38109.1 alpha/beta fold hydrolase [Chitinophaga oryzae]